MPRPPPPPEAVVPSELAIAVEIDGAPAAPITAARIEREAPRFVSSEHRAWSIAQLVGEPVTSRDVSIAVFGEHDVAIKLPRVKVAPDLEPVLILSRRGELTISLVSPEDPFPPYHGRGRRLARGAHPLPRISGKISRISIVAQPRAIDEAPQKESATP